MTTPVRRDTCESDGPGRRSRAASLAAVLTVALSVATGASPAPDSLFPERGATRESVQRMLGGPPLRCISSSPEQWLCTWRVEPGNPAHAVLAAGRATDRPIHFLCRFPSPRHDVGGQCSSHRAIPLQPVAGESGEAPADERPETLARLAIDGARTLETISLLLGAGPEDCRQRDDSDWVCLWRAGPDDPGYATLGPLAADPRAAVRLICLLPLDGGERGDDSCRIRRESPDEAD